MQSFASDALELVRDTLLFIKSETAGPVYASFEEADFFRKQYERLPKQETPLPPPVVLPKPVVKAEPLPPPVAPPKPTIQAEPAPPAKTKEPLPNPYIPQPISNPKIDSSSRFGINNVSLSDVKKLFVSLFPQFPVLDAIPSDEIAVKIAERWKTKNKTAPISILSLNEPPEQKALLEQIAKALDAVFGPARLIEAEPIEKEKQWEAFLSVPDLKIAIVCDYTLWQMKHLMGFYKENPTVGTRTLGNISLFLLPDLSLYLKDPQLKRSLWKALCQKISM